MKETTAIDHVCHMNVEIKSDSINYNHNDTIYYFCSNICKEKFSKNPEKYLRSQESSSSCGGGGGDHKPQIYSENEKVQFCCPMLCEGEKLYDQAQNCPICNMALVPASTMNPSGENTPPQTSSSCCGGNGNHKPQIYSENEKIQFCCPMLCEGEKLYDQAQNCPICNMALVPASTMNPSGENTPPQTSSSCCGGNGNHKPQIYSENEKIQFCCPMLCEGEKLYDQAQNCPICNMALVPASTIDPSGKNKNPQTSSSCCGGGGDPKPQIYSKSGKVQFYCPMLCEGEKLYDQAQDCPICNMALVPTSTLDPSEENKELKTNIKQLILNLVLGIPVIAIAMIDMFTTNIITWEPKITQYLELVLSLPIGILSSYPLYKKAVRSIINQKYNMFTLLGTGIFISFFYSVVGTLFPQIFAPELQENNLVNIYFESVAAIVILFYFGQVLESNSIRKTNDALKSLMQMTTKDAIVIRNNQDIKVPIEEIKVGDKLRIKQGDKIPIDGKLIEGSVIVDESMISGEPLPANKQIGDALVGSTLNTTGNGIMQATSDAQHGMLAQIIDAVDKAQRSKAEIQQLADKWAKFLVPIVAFISLTSFIIWLFFDPSFAIVAAISVFIIACPCALGLATPIAIVVATSRAAKLGLLFKNAKSIEKIAAIDTIVLDKTGTLTTGKPQIINYYIENNKYHDIILQLTSQIEKVSNHPIASSLIEFIANKNLNYQEISLEQTEEIVGVGLKSSYENNPIAIGSEQVLDENISPEFKQKIQEFKQSNSTIIVFKSDIYGNALFALSDPIKETSKQAINNLKKMNINPIIASGDTKECTTYVANYLNIDTVYAKTLPNEKMDIITKLQNEGKKVAMVGDGINDAPALSSADISIAMSQGSDIAIQTADITLVHGDINKIYSCITLSKKTMFIIKQNLFFSFFYNLAGVLLASGIFYSILGVLLHPIVAALAMSLSSVSVIFNSLRILKLKI